MKKDQQIIALSVTTGLMALLAIVALAMANQRTAQLRQESSLVANIGATSTTNIADSGQTCTSDMHWVNDVFRSQLTQRFKNPQVTEQMFKNLFLQGGQGLELTEVCLSWDMSHLSVAFLLNATAPHPGAFGVFPYLTDSTSIIGYFTDQQTDILLSKPFFLVAPDGTGLSSLAPFSERGTDGVIHQGFEGQTSDDVEDISSTTIHVRLDTATGDTGEIACTTNIATAPNSRMTTPEKCITTKL